MRLISARFSDSHMLRAAVASFWNYSGRVVGLGWTVLLISTLGVGDYGKYSIGVAAAAIINAGVDNAFFVRSLRIDEERFERERCARVLFGSAIAITGIVCFLEWYVAGFAIIVAAGELFFNTYKSKYLRRGRPDVAMRFDAIRQLASIGLGAGYLLLVPHPQLSIATALYVAPYAVIMLVTLAYVPGRRPAVPGGPKEIALLSSEAFAFAVYGQGDLLVIGLLAGDEVAGYYSLALVTALAVSTMGQNYANTFIERLRAADGHLDSAPALRDTAKVALVTGSVMVIAGVGVLIWGGADVVGVVFLLLSGWVVIRSINHVLIVILFFKHRDALRVRATVAAAVVKICALFPVVHAFGAYGAAVTCVVIEIGLLVTYYRAIYRNAGDRGTVSTQEVFRG